MGAGSVVLDSVEAVVGDPAGGIDAGACGVPWEPTRSDHVEIRGSADGVGVPGRTDRLGTSQGPVGFVHPWERVVHLEGPLVEEGGRRPRCC